MINFESLTPVKNNKNATQLLPEQLLFEADMEKVMRQIVRLSIASAKNEEGPLCLLVGLNKHLDPAIGGSPGALNDVLSVATQYIRALKANCGVLVNEFATKENFFRLLKTMANQSWKTNQNQIILYFSGNPSITGDFLFYDEPITIGELLNSLDCHFDDAYIQVIFDSATLNSLPEETKYFENMSQNYITIFSSASESSCLTIKRRDNSPMGLFSSIYAQNLHMIGNYIKEQPVSGIKDGICTGCTFCGGCSLKCNGSDNGFELIEVEAKALKSSKVSIVAYRALINIMKISAHNVARMNLAQKPSLRSYEPDYNFKPVSVYLPFGLSTMARSKESLLSLDGIKLDKSKKPDDISFQLAKRRGI